MNVVQHGADRQGKSRIRAILRSLDPAPIHSEGEHSVIEITSVGLDVAVREMGRDVRPATSYGAACKKPVSDGLGRCQNRGKHH